MTPNFPFILSVYVVSFCHSIIYAVSSNGLILMYSEIIYIECRKWLKNSTMFCSPMHKCYKIYIGKFKVQIYLLQIATFFRHNCINLIFYPHSYL